MDAQVEQLKNWMEESSDTVAVTGAGISYMYGMRRVPDGAAKHQAGRGKSVCADFGFLNPAAVS